MLLRIYSLTHSTEHRSEVETEYHCSESAFTNTFGSQLPDSTE